MTDYLRPRSLDEAVAARAAHPDWMVLAGGTDLLVGANKHHEPAGVIDLFGLSALTGIEEAADGSVAVGAAATYAQLLASELVQRELPCLAAAAREIGALQIQARGTMGGNIATSSPVGDSLPCLLALDAEIELIGPGGARTVPYHQFCTGYRTTALAADELIARIRFPPRPAGLRQMWRKVGTRRAQSISKVMLAAAGAVADRPIRVTAVEELLAGEAPTEQLAGDAAAALAGAITPIDDIRSRAAYRLRVAQNLVARFVRFLGDQ